ncbi:MAG: hypothetical protein JJE25_02845 [Bacteroidia bacterium]|nr:hypothetical protein [Bacteroidia bacterium]
MQTTLEELKRLFRLNDDRQIKKGLLNRIEVVDDNHIKIKDDLLKKLLDLFRNSEVLTMQEVCHHYNIPQHNLQLMIKDKVIPYFKLVAAKGSKYLFIKSELNKENRILLVWSKKRGRESIEHIANDILTFLVEESGLDERYVVMYRMYHLDLLTIEEIAAKQKLSVNRVNTILRSCHFRIGRGIIENMKQCKIENSFEKKYYELVREHEEVNRRLRYLESSEPTKELKRKMSVPSAILSKRIYDLDLSIRALNTLRYHDIVTVSDILSVSKATLRKTTNTGDKTIQEIENVLKKLGIEYK